MHIVHRFLGVPPNEHCSVKQNNSLIKKQTSLIQGTEKNLKSKTTNRNSSKFPMWETWGFLRLPSVKSVAGCQLCLQQNLILMGQWAS